MKTNTTNSTITYGTKANNAVKETKNLKDVNLRKKYKKNIEKENVKDGDKDTVNTQKPNVSLANTLPNSEVNITSNQTVLNRVNPEISTRDPNRYKKQLFNEMPPIFQRFAQMPNDQNSSNSKRKICATISFNIVGIIFYYLDIGSDIYLLVNYYKTGEMTYFWLTLVFILLPVIVVQLLYFAGIGCFIYLCIKNDDVDDLVLSVIGFLFIDILIIPQMHMIAM